MTSKVTILTSLGGTMILDVMAGDRIDSLGNLWSASGAWISGPGDTLNDIDPVDPDHPFNDPMPNLDAYPGSFIPSEDTKLPYLTGESFRGLVDAVKSEIIIDAVKDAQREGPTDDALNPYQKEGLIACGWELDHTGYWHREESLGFPAVEEGGDTWFNDLDRIDAETIQEDNVAHCDRISDAMVEIIDAIKTYRLALQAAEDDGHHVAFDMSVILNGK